MKAALSVAAALLLAALPPAHAGTVELGGFACLFGENMALLNLYQDAQTAPINFTLSEGQEEHGIKLVHVDVANHQVLIEDDGVSQYLKLAAVPDLSASALPGSDVGVSQLTLGQKQAVLAQLQGSEASQAIMAGKPDLTSLSAGGAGAKTGQNSSTSSGNASAPGTAPSPQSPANNGNGGNGTGSTSSSSDITSQAWYQQSLIVEQERIATAGLVLDGQNGAYARTPLTPPGTPSQLVGPGTEFSNHIPGYVMPDCINPFPMDN